MKSAIKDDIKTELENGIFIFNNYGNIEFKIKQTMIKKNITRNKLAKLTGSNYNVINRYYHNDITRLDLDVLARICYVLDCDVSDIIEYKKTS